MIADRFRPDAALFALAPALLGVVAPPALALTDPGVAAFHVTFDPHAQPEPFTGRVYLALSKSPQPEPRLHAFDWMGRGYVLAADAVSVPAGGAVDLGADALAYPVAFDDVPEGLLYAQAFVRRNPDDPDPGHGEGDLYSPVVKFTHRRGEALPELTLSQVVAPEPFQESSDIREVTVPSKALSEFLGHPFTLKAAVILPEGYDASSNRAYPTLYVIWGFGSDHRVARRVRSVLAACPGGKDILVVVPDPSCLRGHSVFADSVNNGPWERAFTTELIPAVEARYHGAADPARRYLTGISSGGWASLWVQITSPDLFAGVWSHCPDPVDFHDFQRIDLYAPHANMYRDEHGERRPLARSSGKPMLWYDDFVRQESVMGPGGQIGSFEAVFSPRGPDGEPRPLFDRRTGDVDPETAKSWEAYDINRYIERHWAELEPRVRGKLHIYAGGEDTFYLEGAVERLKTTLEGLGSDAEVVIVPGMPHTLYPAGLEAMTRAITGRPNPAP